MYNENLAFALGNYGITLHDIGQLEGVARAGQQGVTLYRTAVDLGHVELWIQIFVFSHPRERRELAAASSWLFCVVHFAC
jgi:hypothetical protein